MEFVEDRIYAEQLLNEAEISNPGTTYLSPNRRCGMTKKF